MNEVSEGEKFNYNKEKERLRQKKMGRLEKQVKKLEARLARSKEALDAANKRIEKQDEAIINVNIKVRGLEAETAEQKETIDRQSRELKAQAEELEKPPKTVVIVSPVPVKSVTWPKGNKAKRVVVNLVPKGGR